MNATELESLVYELVHVMVEPTGGCYLLWLYRLHNEILRDFTGGGFHKESHSIQSLCGTRDGYSCDLTKMVGAPKDRNYNKSSNLERREHLRNSDTHV